jgi:hypothetical protein
MHQVESHWIRSNIAFTKLTNNTDLLRCKTQIYITRPDTGSHTDNLYPPTHIPSAAPGQVQTGNKKKYVLHVIVIVIQPTINYSRNKIGENIVYYL